MDGAISLFEEALEKLPQEPSIHFHLGMAYLKNGENESARKALEKALSIQEDFPESESAKRILRGL